MKIKKLFENTNSDKYILKKGSKIAGYTANGEHYVIVNDTVWTLYTGEGKQLTSGKILWSGDLDYIKKMAD